MLYVGRAYRTRRKPNIMNRTFVQLSRAWYAEANIHPPMIDDVMIEIEGVGAEITMEWIDLNGKAEPQLRLFSDAFPALPYVADMLMLLPSLGTSFAPSVFCDLLTRLGFTDVTPLERK